MEALENIESGVSRLSAARHYIEQLSRARSAPTAKLRLAALRHLFDWMVIGEIMPTDHRRRGARERSEGDVISDLRPLARSADRQSPAPGECLCDDPASCAGGRDHDQDRE